MKRFLIAGAILLAAAANASAGDIYIPPLAPMYTKAPPSAVYGSTGFYVGGNVGYAWGRANNTDNAAAPCPVCLVRRMICVPKLCWVQPTA